MRAWFLVSVLLVCAGCSVRVRPPVVSVLVHARIRADARVRVEAAVAVPLEGAAVVEFFGVPLDDAKDVVFVLDRSGSMDEPATGRLADLKATQSPAEIPRKIDVAHAELVDALERLPAGTRMNVVFFNDMVDAFAPGLIELEDSSRGALIGFVRQTVPENQTALSLALRTAFLMNARRVVLLSDGLGNVGGDAGTVLRDAREAMLGGVRIDAIGLGQNQDDALLRALADESGGIYQSL